MAEEGKKISFGFAKSIKKPVLKNTAPQEERKVDYIECLDEKAIKVIGGEEKKDEPLVIPLLGSKTWHDRIVHKIDADIFEPKASKSDGESSEQKPELSNGNARTTNSEPPVKVKTEPPSNEENVCTSLEEQAAKEIIADLKTEENEANKTNTLTLPVQEDQALKGVEESTLDDYENIPVDAFGMAMLRGMGWQPGKGLGKSEKIVAAVIPELRPKGMGLGADKVTLQKQKTESKKQEEELKIEKGTFVKIIAGKQSNNYGQIEGFDEDAGRLIVKMALGGNVTSVNEFMVQPVTKAEYTKNAKVLNAKKYEEYKEKEASGKKNITSSDHSEDSDDSVQEVEEISKKSSKNHKKKSSRTSDSKSKTRKKHSSDSDSDSSTDKKARKRSRSRSRSSNNDTYRSKKSKKSKKHKKHDSSPERSSKKHKKRDKERDKKSRDSDYTDRRKRKKHRRSRSRSANRR